MTTRKKPMTAVQGKKLVRGAPTAAGSPMIGSLPDVVRPRADYNFAAVLKDRADFNVGSGEAVASALTRGMPTIRKMVRHAQRMNGIAARPIEVSTVAVIGTGMEPLCEDEDLMREFWLWAPNAGAEDVGDLRFVQELLWREYFAIGEVFAEMRQRRGAKAAMMSGVAFQVRAVPSEMVPAVTPVHIDDTGDRVIAGMVYDKYGEVSNYYCYKKHPGDSTNINIPTTQDLVKKPASTFLHIMKQNEIGARRGESSLVRALIRIHDLEKYLGAELIKKILTANVAYWLEMPDFTPDERERMATLMKDMNTGLYFDADGNPAEGPPDMKGFIADKSGSVNTLPKGGKMVVSNPVESGNSFAPFLRAIGLQIAMATNIPYEYLFMDKAGLQDRIYRGITLEFERQVEMWRADFAAMALRPIWNMFVKLAIKEGRWQVPAGRKLEEYLNVPWRGQPFPNLYRSQEVASWEKEVKAGFASESDIIRRQGDDPQRVRKERLKDLVERIRLGLEAPPAWWSDDEVKERIGWDAARIAVWRAAAAPAPEGEKAKTEPLKAVR